MTLSADDARHLLRRAGYGALPADVADLTGRTRADAVARVTTTSGGFGAGDVPSLEGQGNSTGRRNLAYWWVLAMTASPAPITERLTYFWHSHFACSTDRVRDIRTMRDQHRLLRTRATGDFHDLLQAVAVDPAMLIDLDNASNRAGDEQENFARELMELYTIGNHTFTEDEVISVARAWTGHNIDDSRPPRYRFYSDRHDKHDKTLFGLTRKWDGPDTITELVRGVRQDTTASFIATKLWREFGDPASASPALLDHLAAAMKASGMSALAVVRAIFEHDDFWAPERRYVMVKDPISWIVELQRRTGVTLSASRLDQRCEHLNQQLLRPPSVAGWGHNGAWLSSAQLLTRNRVALDFARDATDRGFLAGIADRSADDAAQLVLDRFGIPDASPGTREAVARWHREARDDLNDTWMEREAFRVGAMLPEVNLA